MWVSLARTIPRLFVAAAWHAHPAATLFRSLDPWPDTGGSQWFITHSPQPHLDARYTVFGRVTSGMEIVDQIQQGDVVRSVRVWDGTAMTASGMRE